MFPWCECRRRSSISFILGKANPEYVNLHRWIKEGYGSHRRRTLDDALERMRARLGFFVNRGSTSSCLVLLFFSTSLPVESHWPNFLRAALLPDSKYSARVRRWDGKTGFLANANAERYDSVTGLIRGACHDDMIASIKKNSLVRLEYVYLEIYRGKRAQFRHADSSLVASHDGLYE